MLKVLIAALALTAGTMLGVPAALAHSPGGELSLGAYRSPGLAAGLSLTPLPIDFGNLYAENFEWGVIYTAVEVSLFTPAMWLAGGHMTGGHMGYRNDSGTNVLTDQEKGVLIGLAVGYVATKLVSAFHAGYAARTFNERQSRMQASLAPVRSGAIASMSLRF